MQVERRADNPNCHCRRVDGKSCDSGNDWISPHICCECGEEWTPVEGHDHGPVAQTGEQFVRNE